MISITENEKKQIIQCFNFPYNEESVLSEEKAKEAFAFERNFSLFLGRLSTSDKVYGYSLEDKVVFEVETKKTFVPKLFYGKTFVDPEHSSIVFNAEFENLMLTASEKKTLERTQSNIWFRKQLLESDIKKHDNTLYTTNFHLYLALSIASNVKKGEKEAAVHLNEDIGFCKNELEHFLQNLFLLKNGYGRAKIHISPRAVKVKKPKDILNILSKPNEIFYDNVILAS